MTLQPARPPLIAATVLALVACGELPRKSPPSSSSPNDGRYTMSSDAPPEPAEIPAEVASTPDAIPAAEPLSRSGNPDYYTVFGKTYFVKKQRDYDFTEHGKASWYAKKFHGHKTASGEIYNMFAMTAAHKTLPLPSYVRVTRIDNGKSCIVKVNDRGPFHPGRIIDLSYAAASRLGIINAGEAEVRIEVVSPEERVQMAAVAPAAPAVSNWRPGYWIVGRFDDPIDAALLREDLRGAGLNADIQDLLENGASLMRVVVGPFSEEAASAAAHQALRARGLEPAWRVN